MIAFKENKLITEFKRIKPRLRAILFEISFWLEERFHNDPLKSQLVITSLLRKGNEASVHFWGRGADFRVKQFDVAELWELEKYVNEHFPYGDGKHSAIVFHSKNGTIDDNLQAMGDPDFHAHLQVKGGDR